MARGSSGSAVRIVVGAALAAGAAEGGVILADAAREAGQTELLCSGLALSFLFAALFWIMLRRLRRPV